MPLRITETGTGSQEAPLQHVVDDRTSSESPNPTADYSSIAVSSTTSQAPHLLQGPKLPPYLSRSTQVTTASLAMDLNSRIQALPQELQDEILQLVLHAALPPQYRLFQNDQLRYQMVRQKPVSWESARQNLYGWTSLWRMTPESEHQVCQHANQFGQPTNCSCPLLFCWSDALWVEVNASDIPAGNITLFDQNYRPPVALQIDRKTRSTMSKIFYTDTVFLQTDSGVVYDDFASYRWLKSMTLEHRGMVEMFVLEGLKLATG